MTAAMNGAVNLSVSDGWIPEFARHGVNSFIIPPADETCSIQEQDLQDRDHLYDILEQELIPMYYQQPEKWLSIMKQGMRDVAPAFGANRMADEYYVRMFT
jgi:starch phosphorylase